MWWKRKNADGESRRGIGLSGRTRGGQSSGVNASQFNLTTRHIDFEKINLTKSASRKCTVKDGDPDLKLYVDNSGTDWFRASITHNPTTGRSLIQVDLVTGGLPNSSKKYEGYIKLYLQKNGRIREDNIYVTGTVTYSINKWWSRLIKIFGGLLTLSSIPFIAYQFPCLSMSKPDLKGIKCFKLEGPGNEKKIFDPVKELIKPGQEVIVEADATHRTTTNFSWEGVDTKESHKASLKPSSDREVKLIASNECGSCPVFSVVIHVKPEPKPPIPEPIRDPIPNRQPQNISRPSSQPVRPTTTIAEVRTSESSVKSSESCYKKANGLYENRRYCLALAACQACLAAAKDAQMKARLDQLLDDIRGMLRSEVPCEPKKR